MGRDGRASVLRFSGCPGRRHRPGIGKPRLETEEKGRCRICGTASFFARGVGHSVRHAAHGACGKISVREKPEKGKRPDRFRPGRLRDGRMLVSPLLKTVPTHLFLRQAGPLPPRTTAIFACVSMVVWYDCAPALSRPDAACESNWCRPVALGQQLRPDPPECGARPDMCPDMRAARAGRRMRIAARAALP